MRAVLFSFVDHRHHRVTNRFLADFAKLFSKTLEWHHGLGHGPVSAGAADVVVKPFHNLAGAFDITDIAHRNHHAVLDQAGYDSPFDPFDMQAELGHLGDHIFAVNLAHMNDC